MGRTRTLACALVFSVLALLAGCGRSSDRVEEREPEKIRKERLMRHQKLVPKGTSPADAGAEKR
jgi:hypothetical protein